MSDVSFYAAWLASGTPRERLLMILCELAGVQRLKIVSEFVVEQDVPLAQLLPVVSAVSECKIVPISANIAIWDAADIHPLCEVSVPEIDAFGNRLKAVIVEHFPFGLVAVQWDSSLHHGRVFIPRRMQMLSPPNTQLYLTNKSSSVVGCIIAAIYD